MARKVIAGGGAFTAKNISDINSNFVDTYAGGSGQTIASPTITSPTITGTTTIGTGATLTTPVLAGGTITGATITSSIDSDIKTIAASITYDSTVTAATITGLSYTVVPGTYVFELNLPTTMTTVGGLTVSFLLTTAVLTSVRYSTYASTAADNGTAVSTTGTTTTSATKVFDSKTAAYTYLRVYGSMVVGTGGTFAWQACQNTSAGTTDVSIILIGGTAQMTRVA